jgi:hypothetical protein
LEGKPIKGTGDFGRHISAAPSMQTTTGYNNHHQFNVIGSNANTTNYS